MWRTIGSSTTSRTASSLTWIGTDLVREVSWDGDQLVLTAVPETTSTGKTVVNRLFWRRAGSEPASPDPSRAV